MAGWQDTSVTIQIMTTLKMNTISQTKNPLERNTYCIINRIGSGDYYLAINNYSVHGYYYY